MGFYSNKYFNATNLKITLYQVSKKYNNQLIFRALDLQLSAGNSYAIVGPNGCGKSTLLAILSGYLSPTSGKIVFELNNKTIDVDSIYQHVSMAAPYLELIEEYTLSELIDFHFKFVKFIPNESKNSLTNFLNLQKVQDKAIKFYSSGMKQRVKLALAFFSHKPIVLIDEPTVNLDREGVNWYQNLVNNYSNNRLLVICSNQPHEYSFTNNIIKITDYL